MALAENINHILDKIQIGWDKGVGTVQSIGDRLSGLRASHRSVMATYPDTPPADREPLEMYYAPNATAPANDLGGIVAVAALGALFFFLLKK